MALLNALDVGVKMNDEIEFVTASENIEKPAAKQARLVCHIGEVNNPLVHYELQKACPDLLIVSKPSKISPPEDYFINSKFELEFKKPFKSKPYSGFQKPYRSKKK